MAGVKAIALDLDVKLSPDHQRSDTDIAAGAKEALKWNTLVPLEGIRLTVDHGWVTLQGDVEWDYQRRSVEKVIRPMLGVVGISNEITLRAGPQATDLSLKIEQALTRQATREGEHIHIEVKGTTIVVVDSNPFYGWLFLVSRPVFVGVYVYTVPAPSVIIIEHGWHGKHKGKWKGKGKWH